jgi:hypothetical protein
MAKKNQPLEWCIVRLGDDQNWWVQEISDTVHWDVDALSIIDPRQVNHLLELVEPLREYNYNADIFDRAFIPFRIDKDLGDGRIRLVRVKENLAESDEPLFALPDVVDEENGPYADFLDHALRLRVKLLNDQKNFEEKLTVDEVEDELREEQNNLFIEGKSVHLFNELLSVLDYVPAGWEDDEEKEVKKPEEEDDDEDLYALDEEEEKQLEGDQSLRWDEDDDEEKEGEEGARPEGSGDDKDSKDDDSDEEDSDDEEDSEDSDEDAAPKRKGGRATAAAKGESKGDSKARSKGKKR